MVQQLSRLEQRTCPKFDTATQVLGWQSRASSAPLRRTSYQINTFIQWLFWLSLKYGVRMTSTLGSRVAFLFPTPAPTCTLVCMTITLIELWVYIRCTNTVCLSTPPPPAPHLYNSDRSVTASTRVRFSALSVSLASTWQAATGVTTLGPAREQVLAAFHRWRLESFTCFWHSSTTSLDLLSTTVLRVRSSDGH